MDTKIQELTDKIYKEGVEERQRKKQGESLPMQMLRNRLF